VRLFCDHLNLRVSPFVVWIVAFVGFLTLLKTSFIVRLNSLIWWVVLFVGLTSNASAQAALPGLVAASRLSGPSIYERNFSNFSVTYTPGSEPVTALTLIFDPINVGGRYYFTVSNPATTTVVSSGVATPFLVRDTYKLSAVSFTDKTGRVTNYNRDGTISVSPVLAGAPTSHVLNLSGLDFEVRAADSITTPRVRSIARMSADPLTRGGAAAFEVAYDRGTYDLTSIKLFVEDPLGNYHRFDLSGTPVTTGGVSAVTDASWPDGKYSVMSLELTDTGGRTVSYRRDGTVSLTSAPEDAETHVIPFETLDFALQSAPGTAPSIVRQPSSVSGFEGTELSISVLASGSGPLFYQWSRNGVPLVDATAGTLTWSEAAPSDTGDYTVKVSNTTGSATSTVARVAVYPAAPTFSTQPSDAGGSEGGTFTATFDLYSPNFVNLVFRANVNGRVIGTTETSGVYAGINRMTITATFGPLRTTDAGSFQIIAVAPAGSTLSETRRLTVGGAVPVIYSQPLSQVVAATSQIMLSVSAVGLGNLTYQWRKDNVAIPGATNSTLGFASAKPADAGRYTVIVANIVTSVTSEVATLTVVTPPTIVTQPVGQSVTAGDSATFTVTATGAGPLTYQWFKGPRSIAGATSASLSLTNIAVADSDSYSVAVANLGGTVRSSEAYLAVRSGAPFVTSTPRTQTVNAGATVTFSVAATGAGPLTYQWYWNSVALSGETRTTFSLSNVTTAQAGAYSVAVSNIFATVRSNSATLTVLTPNPARLINLSVLTSLGAGDNFTVGFVIGGSGTNGTKPLLIRAVGPTLASAFGVPGAHADPRLEVLSGATKIGENDNWIDDPSRGAQFAAVGAFAFAGTTSKDAALYVPSLSAGNTSVRVSGVGSASGAVLAELYETTPSSEVSLSTPRLINVSVLKNIGSGLTAGFVIGGTGTKTILVRAVGPGLAGFGVADFVADPSISLFNSASVKLGSNDNWDSKDAAIMSGVGAFALPAGSKDAAYVALSLTPGSYTVQVVGATPAGGTALVEIYEVP
jgi:hypothetical protein